MLPVCTLWFGTRKLSTSESVCAPAGRASRQAPAVITAATLTTTAAVLVDLDFRGSNSAARSRSVDDDSTAIPEVAAVAALVFRGAIGDHAIAADRERRVGTALREIGRASCREKV